MPSYIYHGSRALGDARARRNMNIAFGNRYRFLMAHRKRPKTRAYQVRVGRFLRAQTEAHPRLRGRLLDDSHNAKRKVSFNRYCKMPVAQRRRVDVRGWDTRFGHMYKWELGRRVYKYHKRLTSHTPHGKRPTNLYKASYTNTKGRSKYYR